MIGQDEPLLLALLNSEPIIDGVPRDELADAEATRKWLTAQGQPATDSMRTLREVRAAIKSVVRGQSDPQELNRFLQAVHCVPTITDEGLVWTLENASVAVHAIITWAALDKNSPGRLRPCANDECDLFLIDRSKANNARWCSMAVCGNRMKARRHYQRSREG